MSERFEPYVSDPAEPPRRPRLAGMATAMWTLLVVILLIAGTTLFWMGRGEEDPALTVPSPSAEP